METPRLDMLVSAVKPKQPYPGLRPFEPEEWSIFFGRETMIDDVIERLAGQRVVLIHGASGSGKSSLVRAGVLPRLARQHLRHGVQWLTCAMRPSGGPLWNLAREFARLEGRENDLDRVGHIIRLFNRRDATLGSVVNSLEGLANKRLCILVDQFEELFRFERETSREEAELFVELLIGEVALDQADNQDSNAVTSAKPRDASIHIAITMRSEFLGECARFSDFAEAVNRTQYLVPRMRREALLRAIRRPAELYGGEITIELAERLVADVHGREDELPLIQHGLMLLWNSVAAGTPGRPISLDVEDFEHAGGLTQLLSDHADRVMAAVAMPGGSANAVERLFRALTDINAENRAIRRPQSFRELVAVSEVSASELRGIIDAFRADGVSLLTPYLPAAIEDKTVIDISHEALIRCWNRIADPQDGWLRREFQDGLIWRSLLNDAREFATHRKHILSPAATTQRVKWFAEQNSSWSERYDGGWDLVANLLRASRRMATRSKRIRRLLIIPVVYSAAVGVIALVSVITGLAADWTNPIAGILAILAMGAMALLVVQLIIDYIRQFIPSEKVRRRLVWYGFLFAGCASLASLLFEVSDSIKGTFYALFVLWTFVAGIWVTLTIVPYFLDYFVFPLIPFRYIRFFRFEPAIRVRRQTGRATVSPDDARTLK
jgi:energy-coupling factor transporter ATP-binding protein EcfA2